MVALLAVLIGFALCLGGMSPRYSFTKVVVEIGSPALQSWTARSVAVLLAATWLTILAVTTRACVGVIGICLARGRRWRRETGISGRKGAVGAAVVMLSTLLVHGRSSSGAPACDTASLTTADTAADDGPASKRSDAVLGPVHSARVATGETRRLLPAVASAGLALGITSHVRRERAALLRDAPSSACVQLPSSASSATAKALFESARSGGETVLGLSENHRSVPFIIPLGVDGGRLVSLSVEAGETVSIESNDEDVRDVLRHVVNTLALAPWVGGALIIAHALAPSDLIVRHGVTFVDTDERAVRAAIAAQQGHPSRPVVVVTAEYSRMFDELPGYGVTVVSSLPSLSRVSHRVVRQSELWTIMTTGESFQAYGLSRSETSMLSGTVRELTRIDETVVPADPFGHPTQLGTASSWHTMVRMLGAIQAVRYDNAEVSFRKSKSMELLCWLSTHRDRPTVSGARTAMWELDVEDSTFHNVLSELRRGLSSAGLVNAAGRVSRQRLFLDRRVVTDSELLRSVLLKADVRDARTSLTELKTALSLVNGLPFAGVDYVWADAEGITSTLVWLVTRAVKVAAGNAAVLGDHGALHEVTAAGLRMLPGEEEFIELRRRCRQSGSSPVSVPAGQPLQTPFRDESH